MDVVKCTNVLLSESSAPVFAHIFFPIFQLGSSLNFM